MTSSRFVENENVHITISFNIDDRTYLFKDMIKSVAIDDERVGFGLSVDLESTDRPRWYDLISLLDNHESDYTADLRIYALGVKGPMIHRVIKNVPLVDIYCLPNELTLGFHNPSNNEEE